MKRNGSVNQKEKTRYSDEELYEFSLIVAEKRKLAKLDYDHLSSAATGNEHDTFDTSPTFKVLEEGQEVHSREFNGAQAARQAKFLKSLDDADFRIKIKTFGICRISGMLIPKERLKSNIIATTCISAKNSEKEFQKSVAAMPVSEEREWMKVPQKHNFERVLSLVPQREID